MHEILKRIDVPPKNDLSDGDNFDQKSSDGETVIQSNADDQKWCSDKN